MQVIDELLLEEFRQAMVCERCRKAGPVEAHHLWSRGIGGGGRLDVRLNIAALCRECHQGHHNGQRPLKCDLLALVAAREGCLQGDIEAEIWRLRRANQGAGEGNNETDPGNQWDALRCPSFEPRSAGSQPGLASDEGEGWDTF